ncbi:MAG: sporulation integral membrane protein YtvI [Clostridia bacterium]|nr:sporulation integral membrane protein YtvI [Clostridia bacterium]
MNEDTEKKRSFIISFVYLSIGLALYYLFFKYVLGAIWPFAVAAIITLMTKPAVELIHKTIKIPRRGVAAVVVFLFYAVVAVLLGLGISRLITVAVNFIGNMPQIYEDHIQPAVMTVLNWYEEKINIISPNIKDYLDSVSAGILAKLSDVVAAVSRWAVNFAQSMAVGVPKMLVGVIFCITATFFISMDYPRIRHFILAQFSAKGQKIISDSKRYLFSNLGKVLSSYFLIMCITGLELLIFFKLFGVRNALALAVIVALFDILPVLGVGTVAVPWAVVELINGDWKMCVKLLMMYLTISVIRNIIEPKIVGKTIGLHPVIMLVSMFCGVKIFGALGIAILPFTFIVVQNLNEEGLIHLYKNDSYAEPKGFIKEKFEEVFHISDPHEESDAYREDEPDEQVD